MSLISVNNLTFGYEGSVENIFENVSFMIDTDWRLGLVGRNGRGKTTFLNLLMGKHDYSGKISASVRFDYFPFCVKNTCQQTLDIIYQLIPDLEEWRLYRELSLLDVSISCLDRPFDTLSGGEQSKILLSALFLKDNNFLLIDEPTNNLDQASRKKVSSYLSTKKSFILVSHDRQFLDGCVSHILSINRANIEVQRGNFSSWLENKERRDSFERAENDKLRSEISRLKQSSVQSSEWSKKGYRDSTSKNSGDEGLAGFKEFHRKKAGKLDAKVKQMERRITGAIEEKSKLLKNIERVDQLKLRPLTHHSERLVEINNLSIDYGEGELFTGFNLTINQGDIIALTGKNGSGKSSILKLIAQHAGLSISKYTPNHSASKDTPNHSASKETPNHSASKDTTNHSAWQDSPNHRASKETPNHSAWQDSPPHEARQDTLNHNKGQKNSECIKSQANESQSDNQSQSETIPYTGQIRLASNLKVSYVSQDTSYLRGSIREYAQAKGIEETRLMTMLAKLDFDKTDLTKELESLSSGQKKKVLIASSLSEEAHLYLWDEPLSYIDIDTRMQIEQLIKATPPSIMLIEHDAAFIETITTKQAKLTP